MKLKNKILSVILSLAIMNNIGTFVLAETIRIKINKSDSSSSGTKLYKAEPTDEELKAREEAKAEYSSSMAEMKIDFQPYFEDWTTAEIEKKVNNIGTKMLLANGIDDFVRFAVSRKEAVNATTSYANVINVYKGLLKYVETEDELAYVIGHELGHVYKNDVRTGAIRKGIAVGAIVAGAIVAASSNTTASRSTGGGLVTAGIVGGLADRKLTKGQERRADIAGIDFMVKAGYNPLAAISMMNKILNRRWDIISDHPSGDKRMIWAYEYIKKNYPKYLKGGYDTISYQRALKYINSEEQKRNIKQTTLKNNTNHNKKTKKNEDKEL